MTVGAKTLSMSSFNFDTKYGKQALDEVVTWIANTVEVSVFRDLERSESFTKELIQLIIQDNHLRNWLLTSIRQEELAQMLEMKPVPVALLSKVWLYNVGINVMSDKADVRRFLNRILGLEVEKQNLLFNVFLNRLDAITRVAKRDGTYDTGVKELIGGRVFENSVPQVVYEANQMQTLLHTIDVDRGVAWSDILVIRFTTEQLQQQQEAEAEAEKLASAMQNPEQLQKQNDKRRKSRKISTVKLVKPGFYLSRRGFRGKHFIIYAKEKDDVQEFQTSNIVCYRPQTGKHELLRSAFYDKYEKFSFEKAEEVWTSEFELNTKRVVTWHMLSGAVLPIWTAVAGAFRRTKGPVRIMRAVLEVPPDSSSSSGGSPSTVDKKGGESVVAEKSEGQGKDKGRDEREEEKKKEVKQEEEEETAQNNSGGTSAAVIGIWLPNHIMEDVRAHSLYSPCCVRVPAYSCSDSCKVLLLHKHHHAYLLNKHTIHTRHTVLCSTVLHCATYD